MKEQKGAKRRVRLERFAPFIAFVIIYLLLEAAVALFRIPETVLPTPTAIFHRLFTTFSTELGYHMWVTFQTVIIGMVIGTPLGILIGSFVSQSISAEHVLYPYIIVLVTMPMVAILPIILTWVGFGPMARIIVIICQVCPIVTLNSLTGFRSVSREKLNLSASVGATKFQTFTRVIFPNALPYVFTGLRLGGIFATTTTIAAELVSSSEGLGNRVVYYSRIVEPESAYSCIILIAVIGVCFYSLLSFIERKVVVWT